MGYSSAVIKNFDCNIQTNCKNKFGKSGLATWGAIPFSCHNNGPTIFDTPYNSRKVNNPQNLVLLPSAKQKILFYCRINARGELTRVFI